MTEPDVSIITAAYNAEKYIAETIESVRNQTFSNWEYIIVDNNSKDRSVEIINKYLTDDRIKLYQEEKQGRCYTRNKAFLYASGKYVANLDADDLWHPSKLEKQVKIMEQDDSIGLVYTGFNTIDGCGKILQTHIPDDLGNNPLKFILTVKNPIVHSSVISRRSAFFDDKYQDEEIKDADELMVYFKVLSKCNKAYLLKEPLTSYRVHHDSGIHSVSLENFMREYKKGIEKFFKQKEISNDFIKFKKKAFGTMYYSVASIGISQNKSLKLALVYLLKSMVLRPNKIHFCIYKFLKLLINWINYKSH